MKKYKEVFLESFGDITSGFVEVLPKIIIALVGIVILWLALKFVLFALKRILKAAKVDNLSQKITDARLFGDKEIKIDLIKISLMVVKILLILVFIMVLAQVLGLTTLSDGILSMFAYLPTLLSAILILASGLFLASTVKKATLALFDSMGIGGSKIISGSLFYLITFFVSITALNQAGIDTEIITSNFTMILGAFLFAAALGFGLGSREVFSDVFKMFYARKIYMVGDKISFGNVEGSIEAIDNISVTLKIKEGKLIVPIKDILTAKVSVKQQ